MGMEEATDTAVVITAGQDGLLVEPQGAFHVGGDWTGGLILNFNLNPNFNSNFPYINGEGLIKIL